MLFGPCLSAAVCSTLGRPLPRVVRRPSRTPVPIKATFPPTGRATRLLYNNNYYYCPRATHHARNDADAAVRSHYLQSDQCASELRCRTAGSFCCYYVPLCRVQFNNNKYNIKLLTVCVQYCVRACVVRAES